MKYLEELKLYEQGMTEGEIAEKVGVSRSTVQFRLKGFREAGILEGSHKNKPVIVHWDLIEGNTEEIPEVTQGNTEVISGITPERIEALNRLIDREIARDRIQAVGERKAQTFKVDIKILAALKDYAEKHGISQSQLIEEAILARIGK